MAPKKRSRKPAGRKAAVTPRGREIIAHILNTLAFGTHAAEGDVESIAQRLGMTPGRLRPQLDKLAEADYITIEGVGEFVYPTTTAVRLQNPDLKSDEAERQLRDLRNAGKRRKRKG